MRNWLAVTAGGLVAAAVLGAYPAAQAAGGAPSVNSVCRYGGTLMRPTLMRTDKLGVKYYSYGAVPGMVTKVPPRGLAAGQVTPAMLGDLGLAPASRSTTASGSTRAPASSAAMQRLDSAAISLAKGGAPTLCAGTASDRSLFGGQVNQRAASSSPRYGIDSSDWGGYGIEASQFGGAINAAEGAWNVGNGTTSPTSDPKISEATWVGVGALSPSPTSPSGLIQAGVSMVSDSASPKIPDGYTSWIEVLGVENSGGGLLGCVSGAYNNSSNANNDCNPIYNSSDSTRPGDAVLVRTWYNSSSQACFVLVDYSHSSGSIASSCYKAAVYDHNSGEWINENWLSKGYVYNNPGTISFNTQNVSGAFGGGSWQQPFDNSVPGSYETVNMYTSGGVNGCTAGQLLSKGVNASGQASQIATYHVAGCD
jgi:hypothetical protein